MEVEAGEACGGAERWRAVEAQGGEVHVLQGTAGVGRQCMHLGAFPEGLYCHTTDGYEGMRPAAKPR